MSEQPKGEKLNGEHAKRGSVPAPTFSDVDDPPKARPKTRLGIGPAAPPPRRKGTIADEARLRAHYELARAVGDIREERACAKRLADLLASRDMELDVAVTLAQKTLAQGDDAALRHALAGWLEGLGEPALAASELRKLTAAREPKVASA